MVKTLFMTFTAFLTLNSQASALKTSVFESLKDPLQTIDLKTAKLKKSLFIAHDCGSCHQLLKALNKKCSGLNLTTFAVGNKKNLKSKLRLLKKFNSPVYLGSTTQAYADIGIDLMPYYISSTGEKHESDVYSAITKDKSCKTNQVEKK